jgi:hypothetical protein
MESIINSKQVLHYGIQWQANQSPLVSSFSIGSFSSPDDDQYVLLMLSYFAVHGIRFRELKPAVILPGYAGMNGHIVRRVSMDIQI